VSLTDNAQLSSDAPLVVTVHERLREMILRGDIAAGRRLTQVELAETLGVGRHPLREALRVLASERLVISEPNQRVRVADLSVTDAETLYVMRIALEVTGIRITVPQLTSRDLAELEGLMAQMDHYQRRNDRRGLHAPHRMFHMRLVAGIGDRGTEAIAELFDHAERYRLVYGGTTANLWDKRQREHRAILDAAVAGDVDGAAGHLAEHYVRTATLVFEAMDPEHDLSHLRAAVRTSVPTAEASLDRVT
jgi:DNA-binding GntR family transcriptional regulator